jgi:HEAT repeat protein
LARLDPDNPIALNFLRGMFSDESSKARGTAAYVLGEFGPSAAPLVPALIETLEKELTRDPGDVNLRQVLVGTIRRIGPAAEPPVRLLRDLVRKQQLGLYNFSIEALGGIGPGAKVALPEILEVMSHDEIGARLVAAQAVWRIERNSDLSVPVLLHGLTAKENYWRQKACEVLAEIGPPGKAAAPKLRELLNDPSDEVQKAAKEALDKITR